MKFFFLSFATLSFLAGCATNDYASQVLDRPIPTTTEGRTRECNWIRSEIARQQSIAQYGASIATTPMYAMAYQAAARKNIAALESRASNVQCQAAFSNTVQSPRDQGKLKFDECFSRCQQLTNRSKEQCFDVCK